MKPVVNTGMLKQRRTLVVETARPAFEKMLQPFTGVHVVRSNHDISTACNLPDPYGWQTVYDHLHRWHKGMSKPRRKIGGMGRAAG